MREEGDRGAVAGRRTLFLGVLVTALFVGAGVFSWHSTVMRGEMDRAAALRREVVRSQCGSQEQIARLENEIATLRRFHYEHPGKIRPDLLDVYGPDERFDPDHMEVGFYVAVPTQLPLIERMRLLAAKVSRYRFNSLPIEVLRIEHRNGKQIAVINLAEPDGRYAPMSWSGRYFQGSTGGQITQETLVRTFLQKGYPGTWVDGVQFYYDGRPFTNEWDHILLTGTFYRDG